MTVNITYFVHGTTIDNEKGLATGWAPGVLSQVGIRQAKELGQLVMHKHFDVVFSSDLKRAIESAELGFANKYNIVHDERLRECNYGDYTEHPSKSFKSDMNVWVNTPFPHGESYSDVEKRIDNFLNFLKQEYAGKHIAIVAHQAPQLALEVLTKNKTWQQAIAEDWRKTKAWQPGWEYTV